MPKINLVFFKEDDGKVPMEIWLDSLPKKVIAKCEKRLELLAEMGHILRRPHTHILRRPIRINLTGQRNAGMGGYFHGE